ncbi:AAA family ATPase [Streptacidiphilus sp. PAMC 29251]
MTITSEQNGHLTVEQALTAAGCTTDGSGRWECPKHGGHALAVTRKEDRTLIHCHAGCSTRDVADALRLPMSALFDGPAGQGEPTPGPVPDWVSSFPEEFNADYTDEHGELLFTVVRTVGADGRKKIRQKAPDGSWSVAGIRRVPWHLPDVRKECAAGGEVHIAEGEKCAGALIFAGVTATTNSGGAGKWDPGFAEDLRGASMVTVWADAGEPGREHAEDVAASLKALGIPHRIVKARDGLDDVYDHLAAGWSVDAGVPVALAVDPVDALLAELLDSEGLDDLPDPEPLIQGVLTLNTLDRINGEPASGKSLVALDMAGCIGTGTPWHGQPVTKGPVVYIVAEGAEGFKLRKQAWEQHHGKRMTGVRFLPRPLQVMGQEWAAYTEVCKRLGAVFVVLDTQRRVTVGVTENDNTELGAVIERLDDLRRATGACVMLVHHTPKGGEGGSGGGAVMGALNTEFMMTKKKNGTTRYVLENTKEKDGPEGTSKTFVLEVVTLSANGDSRDPFCPPPHTSVVLVQEDADTAQETQDLLPDLELGSQRKLVEIFHRLWADGNGATKAEAKSVAITGVTQDGKRVPAPMSKSTFYEAWSALEAEKLLLRIVDADGRPTQKFKVRSPEDAQPGGTGGVRVGPPTSLLSFESGSPTP